MAGSDGRWKRRRRRRGGGYSQLQSESNGPATITSAVIMNTRIRPQPEEQTSLEMCFYSGLTGPASSHLQQLHPRAVPTRNTNERNTTQHGLIVKCALKTSHLQMKLSWMCFSTETIVIIYSNILARALDL